ncbi:MAG: DNA-directed RNA polymerase subunit H [Candidatus Micrarchaeota archaeon]|nr:DNA-directed RNA polymerase subunit H [Candidatus Micrarchaeota archaeon]
MVKTPELILKHEILSDSEAKKVSKKYNIGLDKFPRIVETDVQVQKLKGKPGDLVAISRKDPTGNYTYYRLVVKD